MSVSLCSLRSFAATVLFNLLWMRIAEQPGVLPGGKLPPSTAARMAPVTLNTYAASLPPNQDITVPRENTRPAGRFQLKSCSSFRARVDDILRDEMRDQGRLRADMKGAGIILHRAVGDGDPFVLPEMFRPRLDNKVLQVA